MFQSNLAIFTKLKTRILSALGFFGYENNEKNPIYAPKKKLWKETYSLILLGEWKWNTMLLSMILIDSYMIIHYIL